MTDERENPDRTSDDPMTSEQTEKDTSYSPASGVEAEQRQKSPDESAATDDAEIDDEAVSVLPGTGGPDDVGEIEPDPGEIHMPHRTEAR
ncbi:MAG: hypothetical protein ABW040_03975 [Microbacteriaceae bacterium]